ncbi:hypothetical protein FOXB_12843 [Fusarium oxysporum f. sp. conglutinans Fo5176]|uniref:Uncharacterized protein n=1 Tax=Fusarium oxysporum (strain Fo5176) TaxID=660025 RepID=F9G2G1_FUSOF|nr:hypothetical protein FOXB_12843 [Fusarium oxysporum f. sp. conglutinans Fo5176]
MEGTASTPVEWFLQATYTLVVPKVRQENLTTDYQVPTSVSMGKIGKQIQVDN